VRVRRTDGVNRPLANDSDKKLTVLIKRIQRHQSFIDGVQKQWEREKKPNSLMRIDSWRMENHADEKRPFKKRTSKA